MMWPTPECGPMLGITQRCLSSLLKSDVTASGKVKKAVVLMVTLSSFTLAITFSIGEIIVITQSVRSIILFVKQQFKYLNTIIQSCILNYKRLCLSVRE